MDTVRHLNININEIAHKSNGGMGLFWFKLVFAIAFGGGMFIPIGIAFSDFENNFFLLFAAIPFVVVGVISIVLTIKDLVGFFRPAVIITERHIAVRQGVEYALLSAREIESIFVDFHQYTVNGVEKQSKSSAIIRFNLVDGKELKISVNKADRAQVVLDAFQNGENIFDAAEEFDNMPRQGMSPAIIPVIFIVLVFATIIGIAIYFISLMNDINAQINNPKLTVTSTAVEAGNRYKWEIGIGDMDSIKYINSFYTSTIEGTASTYMLSSTIYEGKVVGANNVEFFYMSNYNINEYVKILAKNGDIYCFNAKTQRLTRDYYGILADSIMHGEVQPFILNLQRGFFAAKDML